MKKINYSLNVVKALAVFSVIYIHVSEGWGVLGTSIYSLTGFAVPIFFLISGFYSYFENIPESIEKYKTRIFRLLKLIIVSNGLYLLLSILNKTYNFQDLISMFSPKSCVLYLIFSGTPIATHLWFLQALLFCYLIVLLMCRFNETPDKLYKYIPFLIVGQIIISKLYFVIGFNQTIQVRPYYLMGLVFFIIGYFIHDKEKKITEIISNKFIILSILFACIFSIFESLFIQNSYSYELYISGAGILAIMLFVWCIKNPDKPRSKLLEYIGGKLYMYIYILHYMVNYLLNYLNIEMGYFNVVIAIVLSIIISYIAYFINKQVSKLRFN